LVVRERDLLPSRGRPALPADRHRLHGRGADRGGKAKQAIDTFFVRAGDMLAAALVYLGTHAFTEGVAGFARSNILIVLLAIGVAVLMLREYRRLTTPAASGALALGVP
jgi:hypothetical protein